MANKMRRQMTLVARLSLAVLVPAIVLVLAMAFSQGAQAQEPTPTPVLETKQDSGSEHVAEEEEEVLLTVLCTPSKP